uniref:HD domain-containing protein n=1 Tax=Petrachloros mirabilis TaxID=2918835 RepID=UPI00308441C5
MPPSRTYHDPLHGAITLEGDDPTDVLLIRLIDTPAFQRLRRIRQLGPASLTFHGAEGSRFTHSLGAMQVARRVFNRLARRHPDLEPYRTVVLVAALLHDIGHGPFSHTGETIFGTHHEDWTRRILEKSAPVQTLLDDFAPDLKDAIAQVYLKEYLPPVVHQLVTSQLDCDRMDYLLRDSYFTGASYGQLDLDRIILALDFDPPTQQLVVARKGQAAIEHYLVVRAFMYTQVYNHPKNIAAAWGLEQAFRRARTLLQVGQLEADPTVTAWLDQDLTLSTYLAADDGIFMYHLQRWQSHSDVLLAELCQRFVERRLFKAWDISHLAPEAQTALHQQATQQLASQGLDASYYTSLQVAQTRGYTLYQRGIKLKTPQDLVEISHVSPLVQALTQPLRRVWLIYPREIEATLRGYSDPK